MIQISLLNPIRFIDTTNINAGFDGNFSIFQNNYDTQSKCYFQKWQSSDTLKLQVVADEVPSSIEFWNGIDKVVDTVAWVLNPYVIVAFPDLSVYEIEYSFSTLPTGFYQIHFGDFISEPINVQTEHPKTLLISYSNSENNYSCIFETGIIFNFRVEGQIQNFKPKNDLVVYNDQMRSLKQLFSQAYRSFTLMIGYGRGVAEWVVDKFNYISQCDSITYDNIPYQIVNGGEFEVIRVDFYDWIGISVEIQQSENTEVLTN